MTPRTSTKGSDPINTDAWWDLPPNQSRSRVSGGAGRRIPAATSPVVFKCLDAASDRGRAAVRATGHELGSPWGIRIYAGRADVDAATAVPDLYRFALDDHPQRRRAGRARRTGAGRAASRRGYISVGDAPIRPRHGTGGRSRGRLLPHRCCTPVYSYSRSCSSRYSSCSS
jgi:hypothetical protein